jgi:CBS domain-containing protein
MTLVRELMTAAPHRCYPADPLSKAAQLMWDNDCGCVIVVDHLDNVVGIVTDRDICMGAYSQGKSLAEIPISSACSTGVVTCNAEDTIDTVQRLMIENQVRRLPVVERDGHVVGLLSLSDLAQHADFVTTAQGARAAAHTLAMVMEAVSRSRGIKASKGLRKSHPVSATPDSTTSA